MNIKLSGRRGNIFQEGSYRIIREYLQENMGIYILTSLFFVLGVAFGAFAVRWLPPEVLKELQANFHLFAQIFESGEGLEHHRVLGDSLLQNFKHMLVVAFAGVFVVGFPVIFFMLGLRGFVLGFSAGFLIEQASFNGILLTLLGIVPHNLILIPAFLIVAVTGITFSFNRFKTKYIHKNFISSGGQFKDYFHKIFVFCIVVVLGCLVEAYVSYFFLRISISALWG